MEFRLNKIDPEVRERIKETTSARKVHNKSGITINRDNRDKKNKDNGDFGSELQKQKNKNEKRKLLVDAVRVQEVETFAYREESGTLSNYKEKGNIIDVKK